MITGTWTDKDTLSTGTVTILVPTYNRRAKLERALRSIINQTYSDLKIVVCDNASTDDTKEAMLKFVQRDSRIQYYRHRQNIGMLNNFAFAVDKVSTPFFGFLTDDDYFLPHFIFDAMAPFRTHPNIHISIMGAPTITESGQLIHNQLNPWPKEGIYQPGEPIRIAAEGNHPILTACIYRRETLAEFIFDEDLGSIVDIQILLTILAKYWSYVSKKVGLYFIRHDRAEGYMTYQNRRFLINAYGLLEDRLSRNSSVDPRIRGTLLHFLRRYINRLYLASIAHSLAHSDEPFARELNQELRKRRAASCMLFSAILFVVFRSKGGAYLIAHLLKLRSRSYLFLSRKRYSIETIDSS